MKRLYTLLLFVLVTTHSFSAKHFSPGDVVSVEEIQQLGVEAFFRNESIPDSIFVLMQGKSFKSNCTIRRDELRYLTCLHRDADGRSIVGEMIVNKKIAKDVLDIFRELYKASYPIERMRLIDYWDADDESSMRANNSSSFNFRFVSHTNVVSLHGKGMAVDINPLYNPYWKKVNGKEIVEPSTGKPYLDRRKNFKYKIVKGDLCYRLFKKHGFVWGGDWTKLKDYQHFEHP